MALTEVEQLISEGRLAEALKLMQVRLSGDVDPSLRFTLVMRMADLLTWHMSDSEAALRHYQEALSIARQYRLPEEYRAELGVGQSLHQLGRAGEAAQWLERAATGAGRAGDSLTWAAALTIQGNILMEQAEYLEAARLFELVVQAAEAEEEPHLRAQATATLALLYAYTERFTEAEELGRKAIALAKETGDVGQVAVGYLRMGQVMYQQERLGPAYYWFKAGADVAREAGMSQIEQVLAEAAQATGIQPETKAHDDDHDHDHGDGEPT